MDLRTLYIFKDLLQKDKITEFGKNQKEVKEKLHKLLKSNNMKLTELEVKHG